jgi:hypothetical protein
VAARGRGRRRGFSIPGILPRRGTGPTSRSQAEPQQGEQLENVGPLGEQPQNTIPDTTKTPSSAGPGAPPEPSNAVPPAAPPAPPEPGTPLKKPGSFVRPGTQGAKAFRSGQYGMRYVNYGRRTGSTNARPPALTGAAPAAAGLHEPGEDLKTAINRRIRGK